MQATDEQLEAVEMFHRGDALKINAFAGTGKTTTLELIAKSTPKRGMYLAFNKSIANEAKRKFPKNVICSTVHSLAYRATPQEYKQGDKMTGSLNANAFATHLGYNDIVIGSIKLTKRQRGHLAKEALQKFLQDEKPSIDHNHYPDLARYAKLAHVDDVDKDTICKDAVTGARRIWERMISPGDATPLGHDGYLKLWALSQPKLAADFILLDEAQDTNPVILDMLSKQQAQIVYVGDKHQQIYEWRGAVNAMESAKAANTTYLTTSFRFGEAIANAASAVLKRLEESRPLSGNPNKQAFLQCDAYDAYIARTNASVMAAALRALDNHEKPYIVGGTSELIRMLRGVKDLRQNRPSDVPEFFGFSNWNEVIEVSTQPEGAQLKTFVNLVEQHGEDNLIQSLQATEDDESRATLIISTAHKAKGREWETVGLADDFLPSPPDTPKKIDEAEIRLFYVALTRARTAVDISPGHAEIFGLDQNASIRLPIAGHPLEPPALLLNDTLPRVSDTQAKASDQHSLRANAEVSHNLEIFEDIKSAQPLQAPNPIPEQNSSKINPTTVILLGIIAVLVILLIK